MKSFLRTSSWSPSTVMNFFHGCARPLELGAAEAGCQHTWKLSEMVSSSGNPPLTFVLVLEELGMMSDDWSEPLVLELDLRLRLELEPSGPWWSLLLMCPTVSRRQLTSASLQNAARHCRWPRGGRTLCSLRDFRTRHQSTYMAAITTRRY